MLFSSPVTAVRQLWRHCRLTLLRAVCLLCKIPLLTSLCTVVLSTVDQGLVRQELELRLAISTIHVDKAGVSAALACPALCCWQDTGCLVTSCLLFHTHVSMARVTLTSAVWGNLSLSFQQTLWACACVCPLIGISKDVWARLPGMALVSAGGQCVCALMSMSVCVCVCVRLPGGGGLGLDCNDNGEEFKWEKKWGSGTFARRMEEALAPLLFFLFVILPLYLSITNPSLSVSLTLGCYISHKNHSASLDFISAYPYLHYLPACPSTLVNLSSIPPPLFCSQESEVCHTMPSWEALIKFFAPDAYSSSRALSITSVRAGAYK